MILKNSNFYLFLILASVVSSFVFCLGFFPYAVVKDLKEDETIAPKRNENHGITQVNRTILMIIDAFRLDFLDSESFGYLHQLLAQKEGCLLKLTVNLPTVTKPRIKVSSTINSNANNTLD